MSVLLVVFVMGVVDQGWLLARQGQLLRVCRDGALRGAMVKSPDSPATAARARALEALTEAGFDKTTASLKTNVTTLASGKVISLGVAVPTSSIFGVVAGVHQMQCETTMRLQDQR